MKVIRYVILSSLHGWHHAQAKVTEVCARSTLTVTLQFYTVHAK